MGIATLRRHNDEPVREVQPGLISREDHERVVRDLEERFAVEVAAITRQLEEATLARHELSDYQKRDLLDKQSTREGAALPGQSVIDRGAVVRGGQSVPAGGGTTTVTDAQGRTDGTKTNPDNQPAGPTGDTGEHPQSGDPERVKRDVNYEGSNDDPRQTSLEETPPSEPSLDETVHGKKQTQKRRY